LDDVVTWDGTVVHLAKRRDEIESIEPSRERNVSDDT